MAHLDESVSGVVRCFTFYLMNGTLGINIKDPNDESRTILKGIDYRKYLFKDTPSILEMVYAIFLNVLEVDENGKVTDVRNAYLRVCQYLRSCYDENEYEVVPPFESWEMELH